MSQPQINALLIGTAFLVAIGGLGYSAYKDHQVIEYQKYNPDDYDVQDVHDKYDIYSDSDEDTPRHDVQKIQIREKRRAPSFSSDSPSESYDEFDPLNNVDVSKFNKEYIDPSRLERFQKLSGGSRCKHCHRQTRKK